jgi:hypothetical protein
MHFVKCYLAFIAVCWLGYHGTWWLARILGLN